MRILFWPELYPPYLGGIERQSAMLVAVLAEQGHEVVVVSSHMNLDLPDEHEAAPGVPGHRLHLRDAIEERDLEALATARRRLTTISRDLAPDVVVKRDLGASAMFLDAVLDAPPVRPALVVGADFTPSDTAEGPGPIHHRTLARSDAVATCARQLRDEIEASRPELAGEVEVIPYGMAPIEAAPLPDRAPVVFLAPARQMYFKRLDLAVDAVADLSDEGLDVRLVLAGDGEAQDDLRAQVARLGLEDLVSFPGWLSPGDVPGFLATGHAVVMPSRSEAFGLVAVESAFAGRPVVASEVGGLADIVEHERTGLHVPPEDGAALTAAMRRIATEPDLAARLGGAARTRAFERFSMERIAAAHLDLYERAIARREAVTQ